MDSIRLEGARENNLKNINLELPRRKLIVVCGVSGSGKSSLVFDTIYRESRRRYLETLPTYILQFMDRLPRPDMDRLEGLSPAVAIEQRNPVVTSRSTVGTITEIYDYLRLCYARAGDTVCPGCGCLVNPDTPDSIAARVSRDLNGKEVIVAFIPARSEKISAETLRESLLSLGFIRVLQGEVREVLRIDDAQAALRLKPDEPLLVIVDRLIVAESTFNRLAESLATAFAHGEGFVYVFTGDSKEPFAFSDRFHCPNCNIFFPDPTPNLFSFNNSYGACPVCRGFGNLLSYDPGLIVPDPGEACHRALLIPGQNPATRADVKFWPNFAPTGVSTCRFPGVSSLKKIVIFCYPATAISREYSLSSIAWKPKSTSSIYVSSCAVTRASATARSAGAAGCARKPLMFFWPAKVFPTYPP